MQRYKATTSPYRPGEFMILDRELGDYCTLPGASLYWSHLEGAQAWLQKCYGVWARWETKGAAVPSNWEPYLPAMSPWDANYPQEPPLM